MSGFLHVSRLQSRVPPFAVTVDCYSHADITVARTISKRRPASSPSSRSKIRVAFASSARPEESVSFRPDYELCSRDKQLRWLSRREQFSQLAEQCADAATSRKLLHRRVSRTTIAIFSRFARRVDRQEDICT